LDAGARKLSQGVSSLKLECFETKVLGFKTLALRAAMGVNPKGDLGRLAAAEAVRTQGAAQPPPLLLPATLGRRWHLDVRPLRPAAIMRSSFCAIGWRLRGDFGPAVTRTPSLAPPLARASAAAVLALSRAAAAAAAAAAAFAGSGRMAAAAAAAAWNPANGLMLLLLLVVVVTAV
jgi:hypothetical protein